MFGVSVEIGTPIAGADLDASGHADTPPCLALGDVPIAPGVATAAVAVFSLQVCTDDSAIQPCALRLAGRASIGREALRVDC